MRDPARYWATQHFPILYVKPDEMSYWRTNLEHRPTWYFRNIRQRAQNRLCTQFIAHWPDQYDWIWPSNHRWDYEPVFLYFEYRGDGSWQSITSTAELKYIYYDSGHWLSRKLHPPFLLEEKHPVFLLKSKYHAYEPMELLETGPGRSDNRGLMSFHPRKPPLALTDAVVSSWRGRPENPFAMFRDFPNPWSDGEGPGRRFD